MKIRINYTSFNPISVALCIWQLPQIIIASVVILFSLVFARNKEFLAFTNGKLTVWEFRLNLDWNAPFCFTLGPFIITPFRVKNDTLLHESGHSIQSIYLGPLYLLAVAIPSVVLVWIKRILKKDAEWYHSKYPEKWADKLAEKESRNEH
jgi:hypothetical protein